MNETSPHKLDLTAYQQLGQPKVTIPQHPCSGALMRAPGGGWKRKACNNEAQSLQRGNMKYYAAVCAPCAYIERKERDEEIAANFRTEQKRGRLSSRFDDE